MARRSATVTCPDLPESFRVASCGGKKTAALKRSQATNATEIVWPLVPYCCNFKEMLEVFFAATTCEVREDLSFQMISMCRRLMQHFGRQRRSKKSVKELRKLTMLCKFVDLKSFFWGELESNLFCFLQDSIWEDLPAKVRVCEKKWSNQTTFWKTVVWRAVWANLHSEAQWQATNVHDTDLFGMHLDDFGRYFLLWL